MSVFTKEAFQMSSMPAKPPTPAPAAQKSDEEEQEPGHNVVEIDVEAVLIDLDGTLVNTAGAEVAAWKEFADKYDLNLDEMLRSSHGMRTVDALKKWCKLSDPAEIAEEVKRFERLVAENAIKNEGQGKAVEVLPGVEDLLAALGKAKKEDGPEKWTIVTSSTYAYAAGVLESANLPVPKSFITADSVTKGKPSPDCYFQGAALVDASIFDSLVVEDSPTGIRAGKQSGARVIAVATSHPPEALEKERPDFLITDLRNLSVTWDAEEDMFKVVITQPVGRPTPRPTPDSTPLVTPAGSRAQSFSSEMDRMAFFKSSDELTGNDSVVGSPIPSRAGSPQPGETPEAGSGNNSASVSRRGSVQGGGISLDAFKRAMGSNARKNRSRTELDLDE